MIEGLGDFNLSLVISAMGSAIGTGIAGMAAIGAWKKAFLQNKAAPFLLVAFVGAPLSQTFYGFLVQLFIRNANMPSSVYHLQALIGALAGIAIASSAIMQGRAGAKAADALGETGKGFTNYLMVVGVIETVAIFVMVFVMMALPSAPAAG